MKRSTTTGLLLCTLICFVLLFWASCKQATEVDQADCDGNTEPFLGNLSFSINGEPVEADALTLSRSATLGIYYQYVDYDCNLDGGKIYFKLDEEDWEVAKILPDGTPCSSDDASSPVGIEKTFPGEELGEHIFRTGWVDNCGVKSEEIEGALTLVEGDDDDDDDDTVEPGDWGLIENGGFEDGRAIWRAEPNFLIMDTKNLPRTPYQGDWAAYLHGANGTENLLWQSFDIPNDVTRLKLSFYYYIQTDDTGSGTEDILKIGMTGVHGEPVYETFGTLSNLNVTSNYQKFYTTLPLDTVDIGQGRYLSFHAEFDDDADETRFIIDNVVLTAE